MEFGISNCALVSLQKRKKVWWARTELPNGNELDEANSGGQHYIGVWELDQIMSEGMKRKVRKVYQERLTLLIKNLLLAVNTWTVSVIRYSAAFLDWTKEETKEVDRWTEKRIVGVRGLHTKSNVMKIYIKNQYEQRVLISVEECYAEELISIDNYFANNDEMLLKVVERVQKLDKDEIELKNDYKKRIKQK